MSEEKAGFLTQFGRLVRIVRFDVVIAVCALLISTLATGASIWQTRVVQKQLSAQVWPYVSVDETFSENEIKVQLENYGLGPAILRDVVLTNNGVVVHTLGAFLRPMLPKGRHLGLTFSDVSPGTAIRPGDGVVLLDLTGPGIRDIIGPQALHSALSACYCSILDQCWVTSSSQKSGAPQEVASCPDHDPNQLGPTEYNDFSKKPTPRR
jgi:hypothetical protein